MGAPKAAAGFLRFAIDEVAELRTPRECQKARFGGGFLPARS